MNNRVEIRGDVAAIFLLHKGMELECLVDLADLPRLQYTSWCAFNPQERGDYYARGRAPEGKRKKVLMHRLIMDAPVDLEVDHENHNTLDNRKSENLRIVTSTVNHLNRKGPDRRTSSGYRGVYRNERLGKWTARVMVQGKSYWFGLYDEPQDAAFAAAAGLKELTENGFSRAPRVCKRELCQKSYVPMNNKQKFCTRECGVLHFREIRYIAKGEKSK